MFVLRTFQLGIKSLLLHPLRSLLTVLGISIGVWSVITLLSIGEGISVEMQRQIEGLGADNIIVRSIKPPAEVTAGFTGPVPYGLAREDYKILVANTPTLSTSAMYGKCQPPRNSTEHKKLTVKTCVYSPRKNIPNFNAEYSV